MPLGGLAFPLGVSVASVSYGGLLSGALGGAGRNVLNVSPVSWLYGHQSGLLFGILPRLHLSFCYLVHSSGVSSGVYLLRWL